MKKIWPLLTVALLVAGLAQAQTPRPVKLRSISAAEAARFGVPQMRVPFARIAPKIDGKADEAIWRRASENIFVNAITGGAANPSTAFRVAYDAQYIYIYLRGVEGGQETHRHATAAVQDPALHNSDAAEIFLQPAGPGTPYFQVAANPRGGYITYKWQDGQGGPWEVKDLKVAGHIDFDYWTLELAISLADLGVETPTAAQSWRANFCRNELPGHLIYGAWSFTGGGFQRPERFGILDFASPNSQAKNALATIGGQIVNVDGAPLADIPVKAFGRVERSDPSGRFVFSDVPAGEQVISVISPKYQAAHGIALVQAPTTQLAPIALEKIDPFLPAWTLAKKERGTWLVSSMAEPPDMLNAPSKQDVIDSLAVVATPGEYESVAIAYYTHRALDEPAIEIGSLKSAKGRSLATAPRVRWTQRLLKRQHYQTSEDQSEFVWRFLWDAPPPAIKAGQLRQLVVTVQIPEDAQPGLYASTLTLKAGKKIVAELPLSIRVLPFKLVQPTQRVGSYFNFARGFDDAGSERMLRDISEHGGDALIWSIRPDIREENGRLVPDLETMRKSLLMQHRAGIKAPYVVDTSAENLASRLGIPGKQHVYDAKALRASAEYRETYKRILEAISALEKELDIGAIALSWGDEIFQQGRLEPWLYIAELTRQYAPDHPIYITHHSADKEKIARIDPYTDIRCYHGRRLDDDYQSAAAYDELKAELDAAGDQAWAYYNIVRTGITPEYTRLVNGYWLWRTPVSVHVPWTYYAGGPGDMEGVRKGAKEAPFFAFAAPHPSEPKMVSTLDWECFREGYDDLRYIATLEAAIQNAPPGKKKLAQSAQQLLDEWWSQDPRVPEQAAKLTAADYRARRAQMARFISGLSEK
jgi:hypothetical protein